MPKGDYLCVLSKNSVNEMETKYKLKIVSTVSDSGSKNISPLQTHTMHKTTEII
jgi:hypothetical protein